MNHETRQAVLDRLNYHGDHRVAALGKKPWYIQADPSASYVAVKLRTPDWHWLADNGYDPEEFDGAGLRPMEDGEYVAGERWCKRCNGAMWLYRHKVYKGVTIRPDGTGCNFPRAGYEEKFRDHHSEWERIRCTDGCIHGRQKVWHKFDEPRLFDGAEDRPYVPFRIVAWPVRMVDCPTCDGKGSHVNPSIDAGGLSQADFDYDPDFRDDYFNGVYDVTCYGCRGKRKIPVIDLENMCPDDLEVYATWREWQDELERDEAAYQAERRAEMRMGC